MIRLKLLTIPVGWVKRNWKMLTRLSAISGSLIAAGWAVITLIYPVVILPRLEPCKIDIMIKTEKVGEQAGYSIQQITFDIKNVGVNRLYVPSTYFLVRAFKVAGFKVKEPSARITKKAVKAVMNKMTQSDIFALRAQAANYIFKKNWAEELRFDKFSDEMNQRGLYKLDDDSFMYIQFGRLTGIHHLLEPNESSSSQILAFVPSRYEVIVVDCSSVASKNKVDDVVFIGAPHERGISLIPLKKTSDLDKQLVDFRQSVATALNNDTFNQISMKLGEATFYTKRRLESYIGRSVANQVKALELRKKSNSLKSILTPKD